MVDSIIKWGTGIFAMDTIENDKVKLVEMSSDKIE